MLPHDLAQLCARGHYEKHERHRRRGGYARKSEAPRHIVCGGGKQQSQRAEPEDLRLHRIAEKSYIGQENEVPAEGQDRGVIEIVADELSRNECLVSPIERVGAVGGHISLRRPRDIVDDSSDPEQKYEDRKHRVLYYTEDLFRRYPSFGRRIFSSCHFLFSPFRRRTFPRGIPSRC